MAENSWNLTIIAVVALVSVVSLVALVMSGLGKVLPGQGIAESSADSAVDENVVGDARYARVRYQSPDVLPSDKEFVAPTITCTFANPPVDKSTRLGCFIGNAGQQGWCYAPAGADSCTFRASSVVLGTPLSIRGSASGNGGTSDEFHLKAPVVTFNAQNSQEPYVAVFDFNCAGKTGKSCS